MQISIVSGPFLPVPPIRGGAIEKSWSTLASHFAAAGHSVSVISREFPGLPGNEGDAGIKNTRVRGFDTPPSWRMAGVDVLWPTRLALDWLYAKRAVRALPQADVVVTHSVFAPIFAARRPGTGAVYVHVGRYPKAQVRWYGGAARLQAPSSPVAAAITRILGGDSTRVRTIPYPLDDVMLSVDADPTVSNRPRRIVFAGRIHPQKGIGLLLAAFARFAATNAGREWKLRLVGPEDIPHGGGGAEYSAELRALASPVREKVEWAGFEADPQALREELRQAAIFVYPSLDESGETFGLAVLEAMAQACPVIVSGLACFGDFVEDGRNARRFDHRAEDPVAELTAILDSLATNPMESATLASNARATALQYGPERIAALFLDDFRSLKTT